MTASARAAPRLVAHVIHRLAVGGLENGLVNLVNNMPGEDVAHAIICLTDSTGFAARIRRDDVRCYELHKRAGHDLAVHWRLWRLLRALRPDVVHSRNIGTLECVLTAALAGVKVRLHGEHGRDMVDIAGDNRRYVLLRRIMQHLVSRFITVSRDLAQWLRVEVGVSEGKIVQIYNGVDTTRFRPRRVGEEPRRTLPFADGLLVLGTVGRMRPEKDQLTLARAFARVVREADETAARLRLCLVGDGPLFERVRDYVRGEGIERHVWMPGDRDDVAEVLREFDLFVLPSLGEGISNTILEAMASGVPVIATDVGGNGELVVDGDTGTLVAANDPQAMAKAIRRYLDEPGLLARHGAAGRRRAEAHFSLQGMVRAYLQQYRPGRAC